MKEILGHVPCSMTGPYIHTVPPIGIQEKTLFGLPLKCLNSLHGLFRSSNYENHITRHILSDLLIVIWMDESWVVALPSKSQRAQDDLWVLTFLVLTEHAKIHFGKYKGINQSIAPVSVRYTVLMIPFMLNYTSCF